MFPRLLALIPALLAYQKPEKMEAKADKKTKCYIWDIVLIIQNAVSAAETSFISCHNEPNTCTSCLEMIWKVTFLECFVNTSPYRLHVSAAEENDKYVYKMPNLDPNSIKIRTKSRNCTETSSDWRIAQWMKHWMHTCHILYIYSIF